MSLSYLIIFSFINHDLIKTNQSKQPLFSVFLYFVQYSLQFSIFYSPFGHIMLHFRTSQWQRSKLRNPSDRVLVIRPTSFEELPIEIVQRILSHMDFNDRQSFRATSTHFRMVHDRFVEHRVKKMFSGSSSPLFLQNFCRLIYESTIFLHGIAFPQFMTMFVSQQDLLGIRTLHSSVVGKISNAKFIGDISDVFEKMLLKYLSVVQSGCPGAQRNKFKWLLIVSVVHLLNVSQLWNGESLFNFV